MRLTIFDMLIPSLMYLLTNFLSIALVGSETITPLLVFPIFYLVFGSILYHRLGLKPLWLPRCPHCQQRVSYFRPDYVMDRATLVCTECGGTFELWYSQPPDEYKFGSCPELLSTFPQIIGNYRKLSTGGPAAQIHRQLPELQDQLVLSTKEHEDIDRLIELLKSKPCDIDFSNALSASLEQNEYFQMFGCPELLLIQTSLTNDRSTNGRNMWRVHKLTLWMLNRHGSVILYSGENGELRRIRKLSHESYP